ncbi:MAG: signal protein PDZ, partial [Chitinophagaceae bacterium]
MPETFMVLVVLPVVKTAQNYIAFSVIWLTTLMRVLCILLIMSICVTEAQAQQDKYADDAQLLATIPFKMYHGGVIILRAKFEYVPDSLNFILDTGSGGISLDSATCEIHHIPTRLTDTTILGIGGARRVHYSFRKTLRFPGLEVKDLNFHINNYEVLTSVYGEKIDGIIGYSFLSRYIVHIDYEQLLMKVFSPGKYSYPRRGITLYPQFKNIPNQEFTVRDKRKVNGNFYFDTGAGLCILMSERFAEDSSVLLARRQPVYTQAEGMTGRLNMRLTVVKEVRVGRYRFRDVPAYLYNDVSNVTTYPYSGGLVGNDLLRRFNTTLNYPAKEIHIVPNRFYKDAFDYAYT